MTFCPFTQHILRQSFRQWKSIYWNLTPSFGVYIKSKYLHLPWLTFGARRRSSFLSIFSWLFKILSWLTNIISSKIFPEQWTRTFNSIWFLAYSCNYVSFPSWLINFASQCRKFSQLKYLLTFLFSLSVWWLISRGCNITLGKNLKESSRYLMVYWSNRHKITSGLNS